jgi:hypothetical protein
MNSEQKDVLIRIGVAVLLAQATEQVIRLCMTYVLQNNIPLTIEKLRVRSRKSAERRLDTS